MIETNRFSIRALETAADLSTTAELFTLYAAALGIDLSFQDFDSELRTLPGKYAPPTGAILLAHSVDGEPIGCVGLRPIEPEGCCEMKRLYVSPRARGLGIGKALVDAAMQAARAAGYREMRLDTLPSMAEAVALYHRAGFRPTAPYYDNPIAGAVFMRRSLQD
jgi:ribosomal protein S18 acetylase RimI-like enzyme